MRYSVLTLVITLCCGLCTNGQDVADMEESKKSDEESIAAQPSLSDLQGVHADFDSNTDGTLSREELLRLWGNARAVRTQQKVDAALQAQRVNSSGKVSLEQIVLQHATEFDADGRPATEEDERLTEKFKMADFDEDGHLSEQEHRAFLDPASSEAMIDLLAKEDMKHMDADGNGGIELSEFAEALPFGMDDGEYTNQTKHKFSGLDENGDGRLSLEELKSRIRSDIDGTYDMTHHLMSIGDDNGDGGIDAHEFIKSVRDYQEQDNETVEILAALVQKRKAAAPPPTASLLNWSSVVPLGAGLLLFFVYSLRWRRSS